MISFRSGPRRFTVAETREAMEVTAGNLEEVAEWCGGTAHPSPVIPGTGLVLVRSDGQDCGAHVGDVMVRDGAGRYRKYSREEFEKMARGWTEVRSLHGGREVREDNLDRLAAWVGGEVIDQGPPIGRGLHFLAAEGFHTYAWPGDVIVPEGNGHDVVPASDLIEEFP